MMKKIQRKPIEKQDLPKFLKETRKKLELTVDEIAEMLETTSRSYTRWEQGESDPSGQAIAKLHRLREQNPEIFNPKEPATAAPNLEEEQTPFLQQLSSLISLFKQQETFIHDQHKQNQEYHQQLLKSFQQIQQAQQTQQTQKLAQQPSNQQFQPSQQDIDKLFQLLRKLENRLAFLEDKCGYPYQPSQYSDQYNSDTPSRHFRKKKHR